MSMTPDEAAAHHLLCELRTRIATQPLPYQHGTETSALEGLFAVFEQARAAMHGNPGCVKFAQLTTDVLNLKVRPVTAKWHRALVAGELASKDGADAFRGDLEAVQECLRAFAADLELLAYGSKTAIALTPPAISKAELASCFEPLPFGIAKLSTVEADEQTKPNMFDAINASEASEINLRRKHDPNGTVMNAVGLALSGGGIRSATFSLGVVQVLAERGLLDGVDLLSTVSGGGYTGSFLTTTLAKVVSKKIGQPLGPDPPAIAKLRANAKYLTSANLWETWSRVTATLAGMFLNWTVPVLFVVAAALVAACCHGHFPSCERWRDGIMTLVAASLVATIIYGTLMHWGARASRVGGVLLGLVLAATVLYGALYALVAGKAATSGWLATLPPFSVAIATLAGLGPAIVRFVPVLKRPQLRVLVLKVMLFAAGLLVPVLAIALFYACWDLGLTEWDAVLPIADWGKLRGTHVLGVALVLLALVALLVVDINQTSPHRLYRNALAKTFIGTDTKDAFSNVNDMAGPHTAPYHLVNATVNLPSSKDPSLRDRKGDFFVFSKHWSGSLSTGYHKTADWRANGQEPDLRTAMAISGAAASSHMGLISMPALTALITLLNVRLGFWIKQPDRLKEGLRFPGFLCLLKEMLGRGMSESSAWLNLSDGGHIENTGCYELLRRRCKLVIAVDGEADASLGFSGLLTLIRHAQVNLGVRIDPKLDDLRVNAKTGYSHKHSLLCRVHYPDGATGLLLYLKLSLTGNESELIRGYRAKNLAFPHQSTLDQFFDEEQFEAYRQLGVHVVQGLFTKAICGGHTNPKTIEEWFHALAPNLLEPEGS